MDELGLPETKTQDWRGFAGWMRMGGYADGWGVSSLWIMEPGFESLLPSHNEDNSLAPVDSLPMGASGYRGGYRFGVSGGSGPLTNFKSGSVGL